MKWFLGSIFSILVGAPIYLPWVLARSGIYKRWYFAPFIPPFSWRGWIQLWPISALFVCAPIIGLLPINADERLTAWAIVGVGGVMFALVIVVWTPGWAKPSWQRRLEDRFSYKQITEFIHIWKNMPFHEWCNKIETETGMLELVDYAIENRASPVDDAVHLRVRQLDNASERRLKQKPEWIFQDSAGE